MISYYRLVSVGRQSTSSLLFQYDQVIVIDGILWHSDNIIVHTKLRRGLALSPLMHQIQSHLHYCMSLQKANKIL